MTKKSAIQLCTILFIAVMIITACNDDEKTPAYLTVKQFALTSDYATQGTASENIKDAWIYVDGQVLGVYELPARFPVLVEGKHSISLAAGIFENGIASTRMKYPYYNFFDTVINFVPGLTTEINAPVPIQYFSGQQYTWYEDFEGTGFTFKETPTSNAILNIENNINNVFQGARSAQFTVTTDNPDFYGEMQDGYAMVTQNKTFLELNYKAEQPFSVGMKVITGADSKTVYALTVNKSASWNKIYINLSKIVNENQTADLFKVYIYAALEAGRSQSVIYIDNLKLLHN